MSAFASLAGAVAALGVGVYSLIHRRRTTAQRMTIEFIFRHEIHSPEWLEILASFNLMTPTKRLSTILAENPNPDELRVLINFITVLNHYEMVAIGIERKIIDEPVYKEWFRTTYVTIWRKAESSVIEWRNVKHQPKAFIKFQQLADRWEKEM